MTPSKELGCDHDILLSGIVIGPDEQIAQVSASAGQRCLEAWGEVVSTPKDVLQSTSGSMRKDYPELYRVQGKASIFYGCGDVELGRECNL